MKMPNVVGSSPSRIVAVTVFFRRVDHRDGGDAVVRDVGVLRLNGRRAEDHRDADRNN
jgi:hypothetical protein